MRYCIRRCVCVCVSVCVCVCLCVSVCHTQHLTAVVGGADLAGIISGPTGSTIRHIESKTGARVLLRGKDAPPSAGAGAADNSGETEALYVMLMGSADAVAAAKKEVEGIIADPAAAMAAQRARVAAVRV